MACSLLVCCVDVVSAQTLTTLRIATFNASLYGQKSGEVYKRLRNGQDEQAKKIARIVQTVRPDILLINEIDYDKQGLLVDVLAEKYFAAADGDGQPIEYPYRLPLSSNTGIASRMDLDGDGKTNTAADAWGFGAYPGQYAMALFSRYEMDHDQLRTFQRFLWNEMPQAHRPVNLAEGRSFYDRKTWSRLRLSSKTHADIPIRVAETTIHVLASHPTPPVFDGPEDRNGCRNHDEIRFWSEYLTPETADFLFDDLGRQGGLASDQHFVVMGDLNSDPHAGDSRRQAIENLLAHPRLVDPRPQSEGAIQAAKQNQLADGIDPSVHTASFRSVGNMRLDYVLPSTSLSVEDCGVFWPLTDQPGQSWIDASDHRLVWIDVRLPGSKQGK